MLGARARAAEYHAFKAASARQASREAEEQMLPPKPTPISLSAFTKNAQVNRNKGNKNWIPLVLEDAAEDEEDDYQEDMSPTAAIFGHHGADVDPATLTDSDKSVNHVGDRKIRVHIPTLPVPTAPKAMMASQDHATALATSASTRPHQSAYLPRSQIHSHYGVDVGPSYPGMSDPYPYPFPYPYLYPDMPWAPSLPYMPILGPLLHPIPNGMRRYGEMMVPTDISPTKQEDKFTMLSNIYPKPIGESIESQPDYLDQPFMNHHNLRDAHDAIQRHQDPTELSGQHQGPNYQILQRPRPRAYRSDADAVAIPAFMPVTPSNNVTTTRRLSYSELTSTSVPEPPFLPVAARVNRAIEIKSPPKVGDIGEAYDRSTKMQKFVAAQQAHAKTGKTVLHNPDLHKSEVHNNSTYISDEMRVFDSSPSSNDPIKPKYGGFPGESSTDAALRLTPKRPYLTTEEGPPADQDYVSPFAADDALLRKMFNVGSSEWLELKPTSAAERRKMALVVRTVASHMTRIDQSSAPTTKENDRSTNVRQWLEADPRGLQTARQQVDQIAKEYSARKTVQRAISGTQRPEAVKDCLDSDAGVVRAAGHMLANLAESVEQTRGTPGQKDYFSKYKPAPEFAVEKTGNLGSGNSSTSYFEEDRSGFYNAPFRIARDPRFRPQGNDGVKLKPEDEWKLRHEMYGRRKF